MDEHKSSDPSTSTASGAMSEVDLSLPPPPGAPLAPRKRSVKRIVLGVIGAVLAGLWVIGTLAGPGAGDVLLEEDFASEPYTFSTDSDRYVDLRVVDDAYRVTLKDARAPQTMRHIFDHTYDGVSIEATVIEPTDIGDGAIAAVGCWAGESAYMFAMSPLGSMGLIETIQESTGERLDLTGVLVSDDARPPGEPNRLRIDCVGGGHDATIVSAYLNGKSLFSVTIAEGLDSFQAAGVWVAASEDGATFTFDDVTASAGRPAPGQSPSPAASTPL